MARKLITRIPDDLDEAIRNSDHSHKFDVTAVVVAALRAKLAEVEGRSVVEAATANPGERRVVK